MATVSARIPDELKERLEREGVEVSSVIRELLEEETKRLRREKLREKARELGDLVDISDSEAVESIREDRETR